MACMVENGLTESLALVYDGTGMGTDGQLWGGELLYVDLKGFKRLGTFRSVPLLGGDRSTLQPWKQACTRLFESGLNVLQLLENKEWVRSLKVTPQEILNLYEVWKNGPKPIQTSSVGRLFDSASALLGLLEKEITYEAQAALLFEKLAQSYPLSSKINPFSYTIEFSNDLYQVNFNPLFLELFKGFISNQSKVQMAFRFHQTLMRASKDLVELTLLKTQVRHLVLSGGVFQNQILSQGIKDQIQELGVFVYEHRKIPPNDGGISFGQAAIAMLSYTDAP